MLETLSREVRSRCPEDFLYADYLILVRESLEGLKGELKHCKGAMGLKGLRMNVKKKTS